MTKVYVIPATKSRNGWMTSVRVGPIVDHTRLEARSYAAVLAEAQAMYPDAEIVMPAPIKFGGTVTYADRTAFVKPITEQLDRIAHRLTQGAITDESAAAQLRELADQLHPIPATNVVNFTTGAQQ